MSIPCETINSLGHPCPRQTVGQSPQYRNLCVIHLRMYWRKYEKAMSRTQDLGLVGEMEKIWREAA